MSTKDRFPVNQKMEVLRMLVSGVPRKDIQVYYNISRGFITSILNNRDAIIDAGRHRFCQEFKDEFKEKLRQFDIRDPPPLTVKKYAPEPEVEPENSSSIDDAGQKSTAEANEIDMAEPMVVEPSVPTEEETEEAFETVRLNLQDCYGYPPGVLEYLDELEKFYNVFKKKDQQPDPNDS